MKHHEVEKYLAKSGDPEIFWDLALIETENGWFNYEIANENLVIVQAYGPHIELAQRARMLARENGLEKILFATKRNGKAFARLIGGKVIGSIIEVPYGRCS